MKKYQNFLSEDFHFLEVKYSIHLNGRVVRINGLGKLENISKRLLKFFPKC